MTPLFSTATLNATPWPKRWFFLGVTALAIAGIFSVILVSARTPQLAAFKNLFSVSLVVHVDLSVLVWFLAVGAMMMSYLINTKANTLPYFQAGAWGCAATATALMTLSPLDSHWDVIKSNYIPVLDNPLFLTGLGFLLAAMIVLAMQTLLSPPARAARDANGLILRAIYYAGWILSIALAAFILTGQYMPKGLPRPYHFELLFWAGGHILQFAYTQFALIAWVVLFAAIGGIITKRARKVCELAFALYVIAALACLLPFVLYPIDSEAFRTFYTKSMIHSGGVGALIIGGYIIISLFRMKLPTQALRGHYAILVMSLLLFASGGIIAYFIQGQNVIIPAHYHGSIVGVTLALMGLCYVLLPQFGYKPVAHTKLALWQPLLYGVGQLMHVGGLAISGGYGVLRKSTAELDGAAKVTMGIMGLGGLLAIIGGLLFVVIVVKSVRGTKLVHS